MSFFWIIFPPPPFLRLYKQVLFSCQSLRSYETLLWVDVGQPCFNVYSINLAVQTTSHPGIFMFRTVSNTNTTPVRTS